MAEPFMEHPTGQFESALEAMEDAVRRLRELPEWEQWITFSAQGEGSDPETYEFAEVRMSGPSLEVAGETLDVDQIVQVSGVPAGSLVRDGAKYSVGSASPREVARILDAVFRHHFALRPFSDEENGYAVGAARSGRTL